MTYIPRLQRAFFKFHREHPEVYKLFRGLTFKTIKAGWDNYSSKTIMEVMRWHHDVGPYRDREFKLTNNHTAYYARLFMREHPQHNGFFRTRELRSMRDE